LPAVRVVVTVHTAPPGGVFTLFLLEYPGTAVREIAAFAISKNSYASCCLNGCAAGMKKRCNDESI